MSAMADTWYVGFRDKAGTSGSLDHPEKFLTDRSIARRRSQNIGIDSTDLPVSTTYVDSLRKMGLSIVHTSKWLNGASVVVPESFNTGTLQALSFVKTLQRTKRDKPFSQSAPRKKLPSVDGEPSGPETAADNASEYMNMIGVNAIHAMGHKGEGKRIAVIDDGFSMVHSLGIFSHVRKSILATYNIVSPENSVYEKGSHGAGVLALLAGMLADTTMGTAPDAEYALFLADDDTSESLLEVDNMVRAMEMADSLGVDLISASLGYYEFDDLTTNFKYNDLDGKTARASVAATMAARKGILVFIAAGNEGDKAWHYIDVPADADSIIAVGGVDYFREHSTFSSYGPASDMRVKPDVCAMATRVPIYYPSGLNYGNGTSFATPIMAGAAASLWSALPELTAMQIRERIIHSADRYNNPDGEYGYGIPNMLLAYRGEPFTELTYIPAPDETEGIYDISGRAMGTDINRLPSGIYIIKGKDFVRKIMK